MNLSLVAPINEVSYGIVASNIVYQILKQGHNLYLFPINEKPNTSQKLIPSINKAIQNSYLFDFNAPCVRLWHQHNMSLFAGRARRVGFPIFELDRFTELEKHHLKNCDRIFVCSTWAKDIVEENFKNVPVQIVPLGVDTDIFCPKSVHNEKTIFLNIGKLEVRKGHDIIASLFKKAFPDNENVELWVSNYNLHYTREENEKWFQHYKNELGDKIRIFPRFNSQEEVANLMHQADAGLFPSRAEGWNLEVLEMMGCGKKSIVLDYSALTYYCNSKNSYLVKINSLENAVDGKWFNGQGQWAKIEQRQEEEIIQYLRLIYEEKKKGNSSVFKDCITTARNLTWENTAKVLVDNLE